MLPVVPKPRILVVILLSPLVAFGRATDSHSRKPGTDFPVKQHGSAHFYPNDKETQLFQLGFRARTHRASFSGAA
jgi:hypothetical protein